MTKEELLKIQYDKMNVFKVSHDLETHPLKTLQGWAEVVVQKGHCPCVATRPLCPCPEALGEIANNGKCKCGKFFSKEKFIEIWGEYLKNIEEENQAKPSTLPPHLTAK